MNDYGENQYPDEEHHYLGQKLEGKKPFWRRYLWQIIASGIFILMLIFAFSTAFLLINRSSGTVAVTTPGAKQPIAATQLIPTSPPTLPLTATPMPSPTLQQQTGSLPCNVNMGTWTNGTSDWKTLNGKLLNDGSNGDAGGNHGPTMVAPCQIGTVSNYAVETRIRVTSSPGSSCFGITLRGTSSSDSWEGYKAGVGDCYSAVDDAKTARVSGPDYSYDSQIKNASFAPGSNEHTYRAEARDNTIKFFIDGGLVLTLTDNRYLTGSEVGLWCKNVQLEVSSFQVTAL